MSFSELPKQIPPKLKSDHLAMKGNPNAVEQLYVDPVDILMRRWPADILLGMRDKFLTRKVASSYLGFANAQLYRMRHKNNNQGK